jgi:hypothetical protein
LLVLGAVATLVAIIRTVMASRSDLDDARTRVAKMKELEDWRTQHDMATTEKAKAEAAGTGDQFPAVFERLRKSEHEALEAKYIENDMVLPTYENLTRLALIELVRFAGALHKSIRANVGCLAAGLILTAIGSVWSIYV